MNSTSSSDAFMLPEQLTMQVAAQALVQLRQDLQQQTGPIVMLDAQSMRVFDSSAVAVLLELRRTLLAQGKTLQMCRIPQRLQDLVALYGVSELLPA